MTYKDVIRCARTLMNSTGAHWTKHAMAKTSKRGIVVPVTSRDAAVFCSAGGIDRAGYELQAATNSKVAARKAVATAIRELYPKRLMGASTDIGVITSFNDSRRTTWADVEKVFKYAEKL